MRTEIIDNVPEPKIHEIVETFKASGAIEVKVNTIHPINGLFKITAFFKD